MRNPESHSVTPNKRWNFWWALLGFVSLFLVFLPFEPAAEELAPLQRGIPPAARVKIRPEIRGTPEEVRLLRYGWQRAAAESVAKYILAEVEEEYGPESLEAADALDLLVWSTNFDNWNPIGAPDRLERLRPVAARALAIKEARLDPSDPRLSPSLDNMARLLALEGDTAQARNFAERSLAVRELAFGHEHPEVARSFRLLGQLRFTAKDVQGYWALLKQAYDIQDKTLDPYDLEIAETLYWYVIAFLNFTEDWKVADPYALRALGIYRKQLGAHQWRTIRYMMGRAQVLPMLDPEQAEAFQYETLETVEAALGPRHAFTALAYGDVANFYCNNFEPIEAERFLERAVSQFPDAVSVLMWCGVLAGMLGDHDWGIELLTQSIEAAQKSLGPNNWRVGWPLGFRGLEYLFSGQFNEAQQDFERARKIYESLPTLGGDALFTYPRCLIGLAAVKTATGDYAGARALYELALEQKLKATPEPGNWGYAEVGMCRRDFGLALLRMGEPADALDQLVQASEIIEPEMGKDHPAQLEIMQGMGQAYLALGDELRARTLFESCLALRMQKLGSDHPAVAASLVALGELESRQGQLDSARIHLRRAAAVMEQSYGRPHPGVADGLRALAEVELAQGNLDAGLEAAIRSEQASREHLCLTARGLSERRALTFAEIRGSSLDCALTAADRIRDPDVLRFVWDEVVRSRALVLDEMADRHRTIEGHGNTEVDSLAKELRRARTRLANLMVRGPGSQDLSGEAAAAWVALSADRIRTLYREAEGEKERLEEELARRSLGFRRELDRVALGSREVLAALPPEAAIVSYVRYQPVVGQPGPVEATDSPEIYAAFILRASGADPTLVTLGNAQEIDDAVRIWREQVAQPESNETRFRQAGEALRSRVWDPVASHLGETKRVFVVPSGAIHLLNLAGLPNSEGGYLIETGPTIHYLSAERDLAIARDPDQRGEGLLAFGNPLFDEPVETAVAPVTKGPATYRGTRAACGDFRSVRFAPLPETTKEVRELCTMWEGTSTQGAIESLTEERATEVAFKAQATAHRVVHVATHGFFLGGECRSALEGRRAIGNVARMEPWQAEVGENPLLLSGLALAGANRREDAAPGEEDGILTAEEIASLDLSAVEWAVLSACETGVGEIRAGEGVFGLQRAFQVAGAHTLIMSLWSVEDEATREWMKHLYEARLVERLDTAESVRQASLRTLNERRANGQSAHPFYWGAFVAAGDWR